MLAVVAASLLLLVLPLGALARPLRLPGADAAHHSHFTIPNALPEAALLQHGRALHQVTVGALSWHTPDSRGRSVASHFVMCTAVRC